MPGIVERHVHNSIAAGRDAAICSRLLFDLVGSQQMLALRAAKVGWVVTPQPFTGVVTAGTKSNG